MRNTRPVYSTDREGQGRADARGKTRPATAPTPSWNGPRDGVVRLFRERGGRGGKTVTLIRGLPDRGTGLEALAAELRQACGAGGTVRDDAIEIQGDHRQRLADRLRARGYTVKLAGG